MALWGLGVIGAAVIGNWILLRAVRFGVLRGFGVERARLFGPEEEFEPPARSPPAIVVAMAAATYVVGVALGTVGGVGAALVPTPDGRVTPLEGSRAEAAGIESGDKIIAVDGRPVTSFAEATATFHAAAGQSLSVDVEREGTRHTVDVTPVSSGPKRGTIGVRQYEVETDVSVGQALIEALAFPAEALDIARGFIALNQTPPSQFVRMPKEEAHRAGARRGTATLAILELVPFFFSPLIASAMLPRRRPKKQRAR
jgi:membrane-associated protease RseP (regulator of RpoE activity)